MRDKLNPKENLGMSISRKGQLNEGLLAVGRWDIEIWRSSKSGLLIKRDELQINNLITTVGKNLMLNNTFKHTTQVLEADWCASLINNSGWTGYNAADTMSSHTGWAEYTSYDESTRVAWTQGTVSAAALGNASAMVFNIGSTVTIKGLFITSENTKGGTTGTLWSAASFDTAPSFNDGDQIRAIYNLSL